MGPRAALIVALACAGCLGDSSSLADMNAGGGMDMAASVGDFGHFGCTLTPTASKSSDTVPSTLSATLPETGAANIMWQIQRTGDTAIQLPSGAFDVSYSVTQYGTWTFFVTADINGMTCNGSAAIDLHAPGSPLARYRLRALPPPSAGVPVPRVDTTLELYSGSPKSQPIMLSQGTVIQGMLVDGNGNGTPGQVELIAPSEPEALAATAGDGSFTLAIDSDAMYQALLVPQSPALAPHLGAAMAGTLFQGATFAVGTGEPVSGSVVDGASAPIAGVEVFLRAGALPSGTGLTAAAGTFTLRAEAATYTLTATAADWPSASLAGVVVPSGGVSVAVAYDVARFAVGGSVLGSDGNPVAGARVTITSQPLGTVANVSIGGGTAQAAAGKYVRQVLTDAGGNLPSLMLPAGAYDLILEPPPGSVTDGLTAITKTIAGAATWTLSLAPRITLAGTLVDDNGAGVGGVGVTALEVTGLGRSVATTTAADGSYSLTVDAGAPVMLIIKPPAAARLAGKRLSLAAGTTRANAVLQAGIAVMGVVTGPNGQPEPSVIVEALKFPTPDEVVDLDTTGPDGSYTLYLPDPGDAAVDGGTN
jgi:hypothetical protein